ncbi:unnamed protein product [Arctia plantaginis]|uniref:Fatty acid 2-hydroxylase n=1 Tax=Arctia plantaginis TaxID=874455 RepID=A0A8S0ZQ86_ARCPL|nr:unnamed protein product [Arctia plantaginis]
MTSRQFFPVKLDGVVYDLQSFLRDHPGGVNTLKYYKGKSVLQAMEKFGHSTSAYHMMNDLKVDGDDLKDFNLTGEVSENGRIITSEENSRNTEEIKFLEELEGRLDWSKPILNQLDLIAPHYDKWMNTAVYRKCRIFANPLLESATYTPWYFVPIFWVPIILYTGITQYLEHVACGDVCQQIPLTNLQYIYHVVLGVLIWTALEYTIHRWVFHLNPGSSVIMIKFHFLIHGIHHKMPFDGLRQVFPPVPASILSVLFHNMLKPLLFYPRITTTGSLIGYLTYDMIHYYVHHGSPSAGSYLYTMKRYHSNHHFINHDKAYGISSKLWDYVFRTIVQVKQLGFNLHW